MSYLKLSSKAKLTLEDIGRYRDVGKHSWTLQRKLYEDVNVELEVPVSHLRKTLLHRN